MLKTSIALLAMLGLAPTLSVAAESPVVLTAPAQARLRELLPVRPAEFKATVIVFASPRCRVCTLYAPRLRQLAEEWKSRQVALVAVVPPLHELDGPEEFRRQHGWTFPVIADREHELGKLLDVRIVPEVLVLDGELRLAYRGAIDDQYLVGGQRAAARREYLRDAVEAMLAGQPVELARTTPLGCRINRVSSAEAGTVTYARDVAPILQRHCLSCHRPGQSGPFSLLDYEDARDWAEMVCDVVDQGLMPPWHANPEHGAFANANVLSAEQKQTLREWLTAGCPQGDPADLPTPPVFPEKWQIGEPDLILPLPEFPVPAEGTNEFQVITLGLPVETDLWATAVECLPSNPAVVHHTTIFLSGPDGEFRTQGSLGSFFLTGQSAGTPPSVFPPGTAKKIPAGWKLLISVHYQSIGSPQTNQTRIGLKFARPEKVNQEVATVVLVPETLSIPPHAASHRVEVEYVAPRNLRLLSLYPHMHLRGKSYRFEARYPDGTSEILLDVPRWDFNWQHRYQLAESRFLPAGTVVKAIAHFDNSSGNPFNPDPNVTVRQGAQSTDEMCNGYLDVVEADQDLTDWRYNARTWMRETVAAHWNWASSLLLAGLLVKLRRDRRRAAAPPVGSQVQPLEPLR